MRNLQKMVTGIQFYNKFFSPFLRSSNFFLSIGLKSQYQILEKFAMINGFYTMIFVLFIDIPSVPKAITSTISKLSKIS